MSEAETATEKTENSAETAAPEEKKAAGKKDTPSRLGVDKSKLGKRSLRALARKYLKKMVRNDKEFAKSYFDSKSKKSGEKKVAFRKRHTAK